MNNKAVTASLLAAVLSMFFVQSYVSNKEDEMTKKFGAEVLVIEAKEEIREMDTIDETMIGLAKIPKRFLEPAAISYPAESENDADSIKEMKSLAGTVAIVPIRKGEQITYNKVTEPNLRTGLSPQVTPGYRAIAIPVNETTGVAKLVKPGDRVDLLGILDTGTGTQNRIAKTLLQDIVVLAVGRHVTNNVPRVLERDERGNSTGYKNLNSFDGFSSVTLEVEPMQAQMLALVTANPSNILSLSLRNNEDQETGSLGGLTVWDVLGNDAVKVRRPANNRGRGGAR